MPNDQPTEGEAMRATTNLPEGVTDTFTFTCPCDATVSVVGGVQQPHDCPLTEAERQAIRDAAAEAFDVAPDAAATGRLGRIARLRLHRKLRPSRVQIAQPGDTLILLYDKPLTAEQAAAIKQRAGSLLAGHQVVVFDRVTGMVVSRHAV